MFATLNELLFIGCDFYADSNIRLQIISFLKFTIINKCNCNFIHVDLKPFQLLY